MHFAELLNEETWCPMLQLSHVTPIPTALHWLPIKYRIQFRIYFYLLYKLQVYTKAAGWQMLEYY